MRRPDAYRQLPMVVALPETEAQVVAILKVCRELNVPVVPRGAGTGLSGGALPHQAGVVLSTAKFNRIVRIDELARTAIVQPGVRNLAISEAAAPYGLYYAPDPSTQIACTIGGNVAENSGGVHCLKYGLTVHNVLRVRVRDHRWRDRRVRLGEPLDAPGLDLLALLHRLARACSASSPRSRSSWCPSRSCAQVIMASLRRRRARRQRRGRVIAAGIIPAGMEMMDKAARPHGRAVREGRLRPRRGGDPAVSRPTARREEVAEEIAAHDERAGSSGATRHRGVADRRPSGCASGPGRKNAVSGRGPHLARLLLHGRHHPAQAPRRGADRRSQEMEAKYGLRCANVFHAGDGNLHPLILFDANDPAFGRARRSLRRRDPRAVRRSRRHDHRRARRRHREDQPDVLAVRRAARSTPSSP